MTPFIVFVLIMIFCGFWLLTSNKRGNGGFWLWEQRSLGRSGLKGTAVVMVDTDEMSRLSNARVVSEREAAQAEKRRLLGD